ncbi:hypothetical protein R83H12_01256 [Fibrobacteria bacterium R8-3-H12]
MFFSCTSDIELLPPPLLSSSSNEIPGEQVWSYCVFDEEKVCLSGTLTQCPPGGILSNTCPYLYSSSSPSVLPSSSSNFVQQPSSSSSRASSSSVAASSSSKTYCYYSPGNCYAMPTGDNCASGILVSSCDNVSTSKFCNWGKCVNGNGWNCENGGCYLITGKEKADCTDKSGEVVTTCPAGTKPPSANY